MLTISRTCGSNCFVIKLQGDRRKYIAADESQIIHAIRHYYFLNTHSSRSMATCPLCRAIKQREKK